MTWRSELAAAREEHARYVARYPISPAKTGALDRKLDDRLFRLSHLRARIAEMEAEAKILADEAAGLAKGIMALLADTVDRAREAYSEGWSPAPVLGYRMWSVGDRALVGFRTEWRAPRLDARCLNGRGDLDIPHTECGRPPCGVYATKTLAELLAAHPFELAGDVALGLVALSGKVVEHERGYRAARADVVAVGVRADGRLLLAGEPDEVDAAFTRTGASLAAAGTAAGEPIRTIAAFLAARHEEMEPWTSGGN